MSKKKATGGSTMSLKDFHGGSIPSDLPLPSAPGVTVRPPDRAGFDRPTSWGNSIGRSDHRLRPGSAGSARSTFDDKTPFLSQSSHIGRNFDEDERKPLDGVSGPRRTVSDEITRASPTRTKSKPDYSSAGRLPSGHVFSNQVSPLPGGNSSSYAARFGEGIHVEVNSQSVVGNSSHSVSFQIGGNSGLGGSGSGSYPNAWGTWKEAVGVAEPMPLTGSGSNAASKLAHASALEKVSSGRWQSRQPIHHPTDVEVNRQPEMESEFHSKGGNVYSLNAYNASSLAVEDGIRGGGGRELPAHERARSPLYSETKERNPPMHPDGIRVAFKERKYGGSDLQSPVHSEPSERPKLKLLPRSKPLENLEPPVDYKLRYQQPSDSGYVENASELFRSGNPMMTGLAGSEGGNLAVDRPKLSLKTRSQALEQLEGNTEKERKTLFGGARPREFVLKERGTDDVAVNNHEQPSIRVKQDVTRIETVPIHTTSTRNNEKAENISLDHRIGKNTDRRDSRVDVERIDVQKRNWRSENWRNTKESEKHHPQPQPPQLQERPASPETWRKPVDQTPNAASPDAPGLRYGKAASAAELAQAFSKSVSDPKAAANRFPAQKSPSGQVQMPFSRLTGPTPRPRINGY